MDRNSLAGTASRTIETTATNFPRRHSTLVGTWLGVVSALGYTGTNIALRHVADPGDLGWAAWAACVKAVPSAAVACLLVARNARRGERILPTARTLRLLLAMGLFMQFGGNGLFQFSLGLAGLAVTVPLTFSTLICSGALFGRIYLAEPITLRTAGSMLLLMVAITLLSAGTGTAVESSGNTSPWTVAAAIAAACVSGTAFGTNSVVIRHCLSRDVSLPTVAAMLSITGTLGLGGAAALMLGPAEILARSAGQWPALWSAGILNAVAFFAVMEALRRIPVTRVNLLNASQAALCALAGVLWFAEPLTGWVVAGSGLTVVGLAMLGGRPRRPMPVPPAAPALSATRPCFEAAGGDGSLPAQIPP